MAMIIGIYMIKNLSNNKVYIGQSVNINKRWNDHKSKLENNKHENLHLQGAYNQYGQDCFEFSIICECEEKDLNRKEKFYINKYRSYMPEYGYNLTKGGDSEYEFSEDIIEKMRKSHEYEYVPVVQFSRDKTMVAKYNSLSEASRSVGGTPSGVRNCAVTFSTGAGRSKTYKGYIWVFEEDLDRFNQIDINTYLHKVTSFPVNKYEYPSGKYVCTYSTVADAADSNNVSPDVISMCVRGVQNRSGDFTYRNAKKVHGNHSINIEVKDKKPTNGRAVVGFNIATKEPLIYSKSIIALKKQGFHTGHIWQCCNGKKASYKGYIWQYADEQFEKYFGEDGIKKVEQKSLADI